MTIIADEQCRRNFGGLCLLYEMWKLYHSFICQLLLDSNNIYIGLEHSIYAT